MKPRLDCRNKEFSDRSNRRSSMGRVLRIISGNVHSIDRNSKSQAEEIRNCGILKLPSNDIYFQKSRMWFNGD